MNETFKNDIVRNVAWLVGLALVLAALIGGTIWRLGSQKSLVDTLEQRIDSKSEALAGGFFMGDSHVDRDAARATLSEWSAMMDSGPLRIAEMSAAAKASGFSITSMESSIAKTSEDGSIVSCSHALRGAGNHRQIAQFLDKLNSGRGMTAIDDLEIEPDEDLKPGLLATALTVTWYAQGRVDPAPEEGGSE